MMLVERIRNSKTAISRRARTTKFNWSEFKKLTDHDERIAYAKERLEFLGEGSSREVYVLTSKHVLKIAIDDAGNGQNKAEADVFRSSSDLVAKVYDSDPGFGWISSELVYPFDHPDEIIKIMPDIDDVGHWSDFIAHACSDYPEQQYIKTFAPQLLDFANTIGKLSEENDLILGDLQKASSWGRGTDGRLVLIDYGFTDDVANNFY